MPSPGGSFGPTQILRYCWNTVADGIRVLMSGFDGSTYNTALVDSDGRVASSEVYDVISEGTVTLTGIDTHTISQNTSRRGGIEVWVPNDQVGQVHVSFVTDRGVDGLRVQAGINRRFPTRSAVHVHSNNGVGVQIKFGYAEYG